MSKTKTRSEDFFRLIYGGVDMSIDWHHVETSLVAMESALVSFIEAHNLITKRRQLRPLENRLAGELAEIFVAQGREFVRRLSALRSRFDDNVVNEALGIGAFISENISPSDWIPHWNTAKIKDIADFENSLEATMLEALILGGGSLIDEIDPGGQFRISFTLANPRAVEYASENAAARVAQINDTTRDQLNTIITNSVENGWSWDRTRDAIESRFAEFATGGDNPRSKRIAVFELGDSYEAGTAMAADEMEAVGLVMEKQWLSSRDDRVRDSHRDNDAQGFIPRDQPFGSGDDRPPTDPGCRCTQLFRRARS